jgi:multidrug resistance protein, MATE family
MVLALPSQYSFLPRFFRLTTVSVLSNMMVPLAGLVDTAFLGHLADIRHLAGVILASILFDYLYRVLKFMRSSTNALTAQAAGREDNKVVLLAGLRSGLIALLIGLVIVLSQYPLQKLGFAILSGTTEVEASGLDYFYGRIWGAPAVLLNFVLIGWFLGREMNWVVFLISIVGNGSNVLLDYLMIFKWGWASTGAGLATAMSQGLGMMVGLAAVVLTVRWSDFKAALADLGDWQALKETVALKGNLLVRFLVLISTYAIFTNLSSTLGTTTLAQNGLLLQIALLSQFTVQGVGMTTQTLTGNFKGKGETHLMMPLLRVAIAAALPIALSFALGAILFPDQVFGLLTNHSEINAHMPDYAIWLLPLLVVTSVAFMIEGYFIGMKQGTTLRNAVLIAFGLGFGPLAVAAAYRQSNHLLWLSLVGYVTVLGIVLAVQIPKTLDLLAAPEKKPMPTA